MTSHSPELCQNNCGHGQTGMRFLSVADRELRSAARQKATYRIRWITAAVFFGLLVWLLWVFVAFSNQGVAPQVFKVYSVLTFLYCIFISTARTADCISAERREGTLGLLFLTNLNSPEIIAGKLCSSALASVYGLLAVFPMLGLPMLMGGITFDCFAKTLVALLNGILFALAAGFLASVLCKRQFTAVALALGLAIGLGGGVFLAAAAARLFSTTKPLANALVIWSPLYALVIADGRTPFGVARFWTSALAVAGVSFSWLGLTVFLLAVTWRDRPRTLRPWHRLRFWRRSDKFPSPSRVALRRRLLPINPIYWLAGRQPVSAPVMMALAVILTLVTVYVAAPIAERTIRAGVGSPVAGHLFSWLWAGLAIHALVLYYAAMTASQRLAEDRQTGALELVLGTPTSERTLARGLWMAFGRTMLFPALLAVLVHVFFIWMCMVMSTIDPPGLLAPGATPSEIFWSALLERPLRGRFIDWQFGFMLRIALLLLLQLIVAWLTLGFVGRWLGLRMKHPGFAPITSLAAVFVPPILLFTFACYLADKFNLTRRLPDRLFLPMMMWLAVAIGIGYCLVLSIWAASCLRHRLRAVAFSRYQPLPRWRPQLPSWRTVRRFAIATGALAILIPSLLFGYFSYQNWHSQRAWRAFQTSLQKRGESLSLAPLLPPLMPEEANFARSPAFLGLLIKTNGQTTNWLDQLRIYDLPSSGSSASAFLTEWSRQTNASFQFLASRTPPPSRGAPMTNRLQQAASILAGFASQDETLRALAAEAARRSAFLLSTNRNARAVLNPAREPILALERLQLLFEVRACVLLASDRNAEAADDLLTGLRLARLAQQIPDARSIQRVQFLLARSLQPLWEGLGQKAWTEPQLAVLQHEIAGFNLLADYTNAIRRVVLAHIELWRALPNQTDASGAVASASAPYPSVAGLQLQPRAWWLDSCILLYGAGNIAMDQVDPTTGRIQQTVSWSDLNGLSLDASSRELLQQQTWLGANPASTAFVQTAVNQAIVACALERFRLANGVYPETLQQLVPSLLDQIPRDAVSGRPIIYQYLGATNLILRGVGPNGMDDRKNPASDDWLWSYPTNAPDAKP